MTLTYETSTCGRCGGSGHYSYNMMHGTVCYGCAGRKWVLTRSGAKAQKAVQAFIAEHFSVKAEALQVGDRIKYDGYTRTVVAVKVDAQPTGSSTVDGVTTYYRYVNITFNKPTPSAFGPIDGANICEGTPVVKAVAGADWERVVAFARTIKKGITIAPKAAKK